MRALRRVSPALIGALVAATVLACGEEGPGDAVGRVDVAPSSVTMLAGEDSVVRARVWSASGVPLDERPVHWSSADPAIATVSPLGLVTGVAPGTTRVAASAGGKSSLVQVRVNAPPIAFVQVTPTTTGVGVGSTLTLRADAIDAMGDTVTGRTPTWRSNAATVASVNVAGAVQGLAPGTATITATIGGVVGSAVIAVQPKVVASVAVTPATATRFVGQSVGLTATLKASDSTVLTGRFITWTSSAPTVASVSSTGVVTGLGAGTATITATSEGKQATARVTVNLVPVAAVSVIPATLTLAAGRTAPLAALPTDSTGALLGGRTITWTSNAPTVATVSATGEVTGVAPGTARISASTGGRSGSSTITVTLVPVASVTVAPATARVAVGATQPLVATLRDAGGTVLTGRSLTWLSGSSTIARVSSTGVVTGVTRGTVLIFAESEGKRGQASITVP